MNIVAFIICIMVAFAMGYFAHIVTDVTKPEKEISTEYRKPQLKIIKYWVGNEEFNVMLFRVKNLCNELENTSNGCKVMGQIYHIRDLTKTIVGLVIGYDLKWFLNERLDSVVQAEVDAFIKNLERFNHFLSQPPVVVQSGINEAIVELKSANQPIMDHMSAIKKTVTDYIEAGGYKLIEFDQ